MALPIYLAMTGGEFLRCQHFPERIAWMESSFSASGTGLSRLPKELPPDSLLMVTDQFPPQGHDSGLIVQQLTKFLDTNQISGVILDFQRPYTEEASHLADAIRKSLPCPVALTPPYITDRDCIVFLPPIPDYQTARDWLKPYQGQEIWLETQLVGTEMIITGDGCRCHPLEKSLQGSIFEDTQCHCHYTIGIEPDRAVFSLQRTEDDLLALLTDAQKLGATKALGLYQEQVLFVHSST